MGRDLEISLRSLKKGEKRRRSLALVVAGIIIHGINSIGKYKFVCQFQISSPVVVNKAIYTHTHTQKYLLEI